MSIGPVQWLDRRVAQPGPYLCLVLSAAEHDKVLAKFGSLGRKAFPKSGARVDSFENDTGDTVCVVMLSHSAQQREPCQTAALLVHEAVHVTEFYFEDLGEREPASEQRAYAVQGVAQELFLEFARRLKRGLPKEPKA